MNSAKLRFNCVSSLHHGSQASLVKCSQPLRFFSFLLSNLFLQVPGGKFCARFSHRVVLQGSVAMGQPCCRRLRSCGVQQCDCCCVPERSDFLETTGRWCDLQAPLGMLNMALCFSCHCHCKRTSTSTLNTACLACARVLRRKSVGTRICGLHPSTYAQVSASAAQLLGTWRTYSRALSSLTHTGSAHHCLNHTQHRSQPVHHCLACSVHFRLVPSASTVLSLRLSETCTSLLALPALQIPSNPQPWSLRFLQTNLLQCPDMP